MSHGKLQNFNSNNNLKKKDNFFKFGLVKYLKNMCMLEKVLFRPRLSYLRNLKKKIKKIFLGENNINKTFLYHLVQYLYIMFFLKIN
jgi:hypothetical protein